MGHVNSQSIVVGNHEIIGELALDSGAVSGEGGPLNPHLVVPIKISLHSRPGEQTIAITGVRAWLASAPHASVQNAICQPVVEPLLSRFPARSTPGRGDSKHDVRLRFPLSLADIANLERLRHDSGDAGLTLHLNAELTASVLVTHNEPASPTGMGQHWDLGIGFFSQVMPLWSCDVGSLWFQVEQSQWIRSVLPGLGRDRVRLVEVYLPPSLPDHRSAATVFDRARRALDERRYGDCIDECRGLLNMWERQFGATQGNRVADFIAAKRRWENGDVRRDLLDTLWKEVGDIANAPHHPEGDVDSELFTASDANLVFSLTIALSRYVGE